YVDGRREAIGSMADQNINTALSEDMRIGVYQVELRYFNGMIDDVQIYNQALANDEVNYLFRTGTAFRHNPDFNADTRVDTADFSEFARGWGQQEPPVIISEFVAANDSDNPPNTAAGQILDGNGESSDWIELYNQTDWPIDLGGWGLTDKQSNLLKWQFPANTILNGRSYMILFASSKDKDYVDPAGFLHTTFSLSAAGEYLGLNRPDGTVVHAYQSVLNEDTAVFGFPAQRDNISYGMLSDEEYYFSLPTPGQENRQSFLGFVDAPVFSRERGYYDTAFSLTLSCGTSGATIRYTTNGTDPSLSNGTTYTEPINLSASTTKGIVIRAAAFKAGYQSSEIKTRTYLMKASSAMKGLPAVCLSGNPTEVFYNPNGVMAIVGGAWGGSGWYPILSTDYNNVIQHGENYERPVSMEYMRPSEDFEFQEDCGLRVHGSAWMRPRYILPPQTGTWWGDNKYSFRLYFRSLYGDTAFNHAVMDQFPEVDKIDTLVLRAGHNDQSNPFVRDEMIRRLQNTMGHYSSRGTFVNLFINGDYKGYYNLCERIDEDYCQQWFDSDLKWDVVGWVVPGNTASYLEARDGDMAAFNAFISYAASNNLSNPVHYAEVVRQLDLEAFVDYNIVQTWGGNWDWPHNNWSAAAERSANRKWRFFVWDAEGCMDGNTSNDRFGELLNSNGSPLSKLFRALWANEDFKLLFCDRLQKQFLEDDGAMSKARLTSLFWQLASEVHGVIPNISRFVPDTYIPVREDIYFNQCRSRSLFTFAGPRFIINGQDTRQDRVLENTQVSMQNAAGQSGDIYYTLNGSDPRLSLEDRSATTVALVPENAAKKVLVPTGNIGTNWRSQVNYSDSNWMDGTPADTTKAGGVGYENDTAGNTLGTPYISYDVKSKMYNGNTSVYIRIPFSVNAQQLAAWNYMTLKMRYDDGFIAYINGTEVYRTGISGTPSWNSRSSVSHENNSMESFSLNNYLNVLKDGTNLLAIHGLNYGSNSSDFLISPVLEAGTTVNSQGISPEAIKYTTPILLTRSVRIKARTLNGSTWSAAREAVIGVGAINDNLRISELMYHPGGDPNEEFIELMNTGITSINLNQVAFADGIDFTFGNTVLNPSQRLILVRNQPVFQARYGISLPVVGQYAGSLDNAGEKLRLCDIAGQTIQEIDYNNAWYEITDGDGFSLTAVNPAYDKTAVSDTNLEARWTFNETSGTTAWDTVGGHPATINNMTDTTRRLGHENKALAFDGVDDYAVAAGFKGIAGGASRTCSAWIRTLPGATDQMIISWGTGQAGQKWMFRVQASGQLSLAVWDGYILGSSLVADGKWHHVAAVLDSDGTPDVSEIRLYVDGVLETNTTANNQQAINTSDSQDVYLAVLSETSLQSYFKGTLDDVRMYSRALDAQEIALLAGDIPWSDEVLWRPSAIRGGTPGRDEMTQEQLPLPGAVIIHELMSHSHAAQPDWIELYNTTAQSIDIGGWFISDSFSSDETRKKYQIPAGVTLTPDSPYYVINENQFNNLADLGCRIPFALSEGGETVYLQSASGEALTGYFTKREFGAAESGFAFGQFVKSLGGTDFVAMGQNTPNAPNAYPKVGPIIITEIMYNPGSNVGDQDCEYLELMNVSNTAVRTASLVSTYTSPESSFEEWVAWAITDGIDYTFPSDLVIQPGQRFLLVSDIEAFNARYTGVPAETLILEWQSGRLANEGEAVQISMPGDKEYEQDRYSIREDRVSYNNKGNWPVEADGMGKSLTHIRPTQTGSNYTDDSTNWAAETPTPGF
ncbi:MAG: lamin tail domain-containing protein, partial [Sedimentisphaerales bacterium]|nr:lamin tail domain-containing protein [Sedimentisphaerales bacterium]